MTQQKGTGLLIVWADVPADKEAACKRWDNEEHLAERLSIPGFLSAARYRAVKGGSKHRAYYELESAEVLESETYKYVQTHPTAWTLRCSPTAIGTTFIRNVYPLIHPTTVTPAGYGIQAQEIVAQLAVHFERAGDTVQAVHYWQQTSENAARRNAHDQGSIGKSNGLFDGQRAPTLLPPRATGRFPNPAPGGRYSHAGREAA